MSATDNLKAYSSPVSYVTPDEFSINFSKTIDNIINNENIIRNTDEEILHGMFFQMFKFAMLCTKHPGFKEEREWRVIYSPTQDPSEVIKPDYAVFDGIPQEIHKIPLEDSPEKGLVQADIPNLIDRIIIGPSEQPFTLWKAFVKLLEEAGVENAESRVFTSSIPIRMP